MELREPPRDDRAVLPDGLLRMMVGATLVVALVGVALSLRGRQPADRSTLDREIAAKLEAAGASTAAAELLERHLQTATNDSSSRAATAYSLGSSYLERGEYPSALRWLYEAESLDPAVAEGLSAKIVETLERMGSYHVAQATLGQKTALDSEPVMRSDADPVVARIDTHEIRRSDVDRMLASLPPQAAQQMAAPEQRRALLQKVVADELLWRKVQKLDYVNDPEVRRRHAELLKELAVSRFVEREVAPSIEVDETDLENYFETRRVQYEQAVEKPEEATLERLRSVVERDYRMLKLQSAYQELIDAERATADVELFPERLGSAATASASAAPSFAEESLDGQ